MKFINRKIELSELQLEYDRQRASFVVIYGRRRVGKTALIQKFLSAKKNSVYFFANEETEYLQINRFKNLLCDFFGDEVYKSLNFTTWHQVFDYLSDKLANLHNKFILTIDEFPYLIKSNPAFASILQQYWDTKLKYQQIMLILSGSHLSMMYDSVLRYNAPLYGRRTLQIHLQPFSIEEFREFLPKRTDFEKILGFYAITGGIPKYIEELDVSKSVGYNVKHFFFRKNALLYNEARFLLEQEFDKMTNFFSILKIIAQGAHKISEIAARLQMKSTHIGKYIDILRNLGIVERQVPVTEKDFSKSKKGLYFISDYYLRFWFSFVFPYENYLQINNLELASSHFKQNFNLFLAQIFEEQIVYLALKYIPFAVQKIGRYWDKNTEIDFVAINEQEKQIAFGECKWTNQLVNTKVITELYEKSKNVEWNKNNRKEFFYVFSKKGFTKQVLNKFAGKQDIFLISGKDLFL